MRAMPKSPILMRPSMLTRMLAGFDVAMSHVRCVRMVQRIQQLPEDLADLCDFVTAFLLQMLGERLAVDQFHDLI